jgi:hypothetical protein
LEQFCRGDCHLSKIHHSCDVKKLKGEVLQEFSDLENQHETGRHVGKLFY